MEQINETTGETLLASELIGKKVFSEDEEIRVGIVQDLMIDPNLLEVAAIVTNQGKALKRKMQLIPSIGVKTWGQEAILVSKADLIRSEDELPGVENWLSVADLLIDQDVVSTDGERLGKLKDIYIDEKGRIAKYILKHKDRDKPSHYEGKTNIIPSVATHSIGPEVLMINAKNLAWIIS